MTAMKWEMLSAVSPTELEKVIRLLFYLLCFKYQLSITNYYSTTVKKIKQLVITSFASATLLRNLLTLLHNRLHANTGYGLLISNPPMISPLLQQKGWKASVTAEGSGLSLL